MIKANDIVFEGYGPRATNRIIQGVIDLIKPDKINVTNDTEYETWYDLDDDPESGRRDRYKADKSEKNLWVLLDSIGNVWAIARVGKIIHINTELTSKKMLHAIISEMPTAHWLVLKNVEYFRHNRLENQAGSVAYEREVRKQNIENRITEVLRRLKKDSEDTEFEYDNFYAVAKRFALQGLDSWADNPYDGGVADGFRSLVEILQEKYGVRDLEKKENTIVKLNRDNVESSFVPKRLYSRDPTYDRSGYPVDLHKYYRKKFEESKNPTSAIKIYNKVVDDFNGYISNVLQSLISEMVVKGRFSALRDIVSQLDSISSRLQLSERYRVELTDNEDAASSYFTTALIDAANEVARDLKQLKDYVRKLEVIE